MLRGIIPKLTLIFIPCQENNFRPKFLESRVLFYCLLALLILKLLTIPVLFYLPRSIFFASITKNNLIEFLKQERESLGLQPLTETATLNEAASLKAKDILEEDYFSHQSPEGLTPWYWFQKVGYNYKYAGENLAIGFLDSEEVNRAWLDSPSHRANLLSTNYKEVGIAVIKGDFQGNQVVVVVQLFGTPQSAPTPAEKPEIKEIEELPAEPENEKEVLSAEISPQPKENVSSPLFSFLGSHYYNLLQKIIYGFLVLTISALILNISVRFGIQHPDLIFKTLIFIAILASFIYLDKGAILKLLPHNFLIY